EVLFRGEVVEDRLLRHVGGARDVGDRHGVEPTGEEQLHRRLGDRLACLALLAFAQPLGRGRHRGHILTYICYKISVTEPLPAIEVSDLQKSFGEVEAVRGVSFEVAAGEVFGFLGPNGAGKTTTINMLCTLATPSAGTARVAGYDVVRDRDDVRRHIGLVFQDPTLDGYLT